MPLFKLVLIGIGLWTEQGHALVLDGEHKKERSICQGEKKEVIAIGESLERGKCEPFVQGVGRITGIKGDAIFSGTGTLIAPDIVLTAAHVVINCMGNDSCTFNLPITTKFSGEMKISVPISHDHTYVPGQYQDLSSRIQELEESNKEILKSKSPSLIESQSEILAENYSELSKYQKHIGEYDIALVKLGGSIILPSYLSIYQGDIRQDIHRVNKPSMFGVAVNKIKENETGSPVSNSYERHIGVFQIDKSYQEEDNPLVSSFALPLNYIPKCGQDNKTYPDRFIHDNTVFLKAIVQPGDSGGPLIMLKDGKYYIVGIAQKINYAQCYDKESQQLSPGGTFYNIWTSLYKHQSWLRENLQLLRGVED